MVILLNKQVIIKIVKNHCHILPQNSKINKWSKGQYHQNCEEMSVKILNNKKNISKMHL